MRIAVTAAGSGPGAPVDSRFLASRYILIFDPAAGLWDSLKLSLWEREKNRGGKVRTRLLEEMGAEALISSGIDPGSFRTLNRLGVQIYEAPACLAHEAVEMLAAGRLTVLMVPDAVNTIKFGAKKARSIVS